jgi:hypothetical protein
LGDGGVLSADNADLTVATKLWVSTSEQSQGYDVFLWLMDAPGGSSW